MDRTGTNNEEKEEKEQKEEPPQQPQHPKKSPADGLICPISLELPWEPVMAEDGRVYESVWIESHITNNQWDLRSPVTNQPMGNRLFPAIQHRNAIENLVKSGAIFGALAANWNEKVQKKKEMDDLLKKAEGGDGHAMYIAGLHYDQGANGFKPNLQWAFHWFKRSHDSRYTKGTALLGWYFLNGFGVTPHPSLGFIHLTNAANQGSNNAAYQLGMSFATGSFGLTVDYAEAVYWFERSIWECPHDHLSDACKNHAQQMLNSIKNPGPPAAGANGTFPVQNMIAFAPGPQNYYGNSYLGAR
ncbi:repeat-containing protein [Seminavis robusta]|uniref:Repeat-containing protein n=1 Tax=Seminavis robusta TaxID=568900 RepID=A0A9N8DJP9_9STRA|nr:repeat-containing protein [Seminavis robusta]|eukprot:Sro195_g083320.1 repeat-containing protein (301) ;mRNA; f:84780-85682